MNNSTSVKINMTQREIADLSLFLSGNFDQSTILRQLHPAYARAGQADLVKAARKAVRDPGADQKLIHQILRSRSKEKFTRLFALGDCQGYKDAWQATWALCGLLVYYSADPEQTDRVFRQSALFEIVGGRWDRRERKVITYKQKSRNAPTARLRDYWNNQVDYCDSPETNGEQMINYLMNHSTTFYSWAE
ncbi:hypothetical protein EFM24_09235 [Limosilactobacillus fermentum]|uniref:phage NrS-1 polymerase family protein n=1 Tax=Limosilactobacillus fermentum TaxID=1613 RepID=UPI0021A836FC|nr:hypothetical protein [Limosilactobacillus fermentum]MCT2875861.1 hypothetical protein [Limosilactobacillus fermentum]